MTMLPNFTVEPTTDAPQFDGIAELPRVTPVRRALTKRGDQLRVGKSAQATHARYQDAIDAAKPTDTITAEAGFVTDEAFVLPDKGVTTEHIEIVGEPGAVILASGAGGSISTADGAHHWHLADLEVKPDGVITGGYGLISIMPPAERTAQSQPHDIVLERINAHADPFHDFFRRGLLLIARGVQVLDSSFIGFNDANNSDSQGFLYLGGDGQSLFDGVAASAVTECLLFGGGDTPYTLGDVTLRRIHLFKDPAWLGRDECSSVKNLAELKIGLRILLEDLTLDDCWNAGPGWGGLAVAMKTVNQDGSMSHARTGHITLRKAKINRVGSGFGLHPNPELKPCVPMANVSIHDVELGLDITRGSGRALTFGGSMTDAEFRHNQVRTLVGTGGVCVLAGDEGMQPMERVAVTDNLFDMPGANVLQGDSYGYVDTNLERYWAPSCEFARNDFQNVGPTWHKSARASANSFPDAPVAITPAPVPVPVPDPGGDPMVALRTALARLLHLFAEGTVIDTTKATAALSALVTNVTDLADAAKKKAGEGNPADQAAIDEFTVAIGQANDAIVHVKDALTAPAAPAPAPAAPAP